MAKTLYIGDNVQTSEAKVILKDSDFVDLVYDRLGRDAGMYLESMLSADAEALEEAFTRGRNEGLDENDGSDECYAYNNGHEDGYDEGHDAGYAEGYADGFKDGYKKHNPWA